MKKKVHHLHCGAINYFLAYRYSRMNGEQIHNPGSKFALTGKTKREIVRDISEIKKTAKTF